MRTPMFTGCATAITTPFKGGMIDFPLLRRQLDFQLEGGIDAIVVCGTTGEASTMTYHERMRTIEAVVEHIEGRVPVIAGSGSNSTENAAALSKDAQRAGANGLLTVTPYYNKATQEGLVRHFSVLADAVDIPIILYSVPGRTGVTIAPETYARLARHPNIQGTKEASGDLGALQWAKALCPEDFSFWSGNDEDTVAMMALGGKGVISVASNLVPGELHTLTALCAAGDYAAAGRQQVALKRLIDALFCEVNPIPVKTAMALLGRDSGELRLPLCPPSEQNKERIRQTLVEYGLLDG